jgi:hypothetical protein
MAFKTFTPGVLTSSDVNTFLMRQAVIVCTSTTRPASPNEGMTIYETDTKLYRSYSGTAWEIILEPGAWRSYTVSFNNQGSGTDWVLGNGTIDAAYIRVGRMVHFRIAITFGSTSVFGTKLLRLPTPTGRKTLGPGTNMIGQILCFDTSTTVTSPGFAFLGAATNVFIPAAITANLAYVTFDELSPTVPFTWASGDTLTVSATYEST